MKTRALLVATVWAIVILIVLAIAWHYLTPEAAHFLNQWQLNTLLRFILIIAVTVVLVEKI